MVSNTWNRNLEGVTVLGEEVVEEVDEGERRSEKSAAGKQQQEKLQQVYGRPGGRPSAEAGARSTGPVDRGAQTCTTCTEGWRSTGPVDRRKRAVDRAVDRLK